MRRVLITGAAGRIGSTLRNGFRGRVSALRLLDTALLGDAQQGEELYAADVRDLPARTDEHIGPDAPPRPDTLYGLGKVFAENLGRLYADKYGLEVACLRIGTFAEQPTDIRHLSTWLSPRDAVELFYCAVTAPNLGFVVAYGISANERRWWDLAPAEKFGYRPVDNAENWASQLSTPGDRAPSGDLQGADYARQQPPA